MQAQTPRRLTAFTRSKLSAGSSAASLGGTWMPALLKAMSSARSSTTVRSIIAATWVLVRHVAGHGQTACGPHAVKASAAEHPAPAVDVGQHNGGAGLREGRDGGEADAGAGAGDERNLASEIIGE